MAERWVVPEARLICEQIDGTCAAQRCIVDDAEIELARRVREDALLADMKRALRVRGLGPSDLIDRWRLAVFIDVLQRTRQSPGVTVSTQLPRKPWVARNLRRSGKA